MAVDAQQSDILARILARLRAQLTLNERQCYEVLEPTETPEFPPGGDYWVTVAVGDGTFDEAAQIGGGAEQVLEQASVTVTACMKIQLDPGDHAEKLLRDITRGLLPLKRKILKALCGYDLASEAGDPLLTQYLTAIKAFRPRYDPQNNVAMIAVGFAVDFNWDLS